MALSVKLPPMPTLLFQRGRCQFFSSLDLASWEPAKESRENDLGRNQSSIGGRPVSSDIIVYDQCAVLSDGLRLQRSRKHPTQSLDDMPSPGPVSTARFGKRSCRRSSQRRLLEASEHRLPRVSWLQLARNGSECTETPAKSWRLKRRESYGMRIAVNQVFHSHDPEHERCI
nr:hypothetical protein CFP56_25855 [Quercus suber]